MKGNMSYTLNLNFEIIDIIRALKRFRGCNARTLIEDAIECYMEKNKIDYSIDEDTVWIWEEDGEYKAGFMSRSDEIWHSCGSHKFEWEDEDENWVEMLPFYGVNETD